MEYVEEVLDRQTGDLKTRSLGNWITITELGKLKGEGPRRTRSILDAMDVLQIEGEAQSRRSRYRLQPWVLERGWGKRNRPRNGYPFDVLGPAIQDWIDERWSSTKSVVEDRTSATHVRTARKALNDFKYARAEPDMETRCQACWLMDHFPDLSQSEVGAILYVSQACIAKFARDRKTQRERAERFKRMDPKEISRRDLPFINRSSPMMSLDCVRVV